MPEITSDPFRYNVSLAAYTTLGVEVQARKFLSVTSEEQLKQVLKTGEACGEPCLILGGGSNVLFTDDYKGCILHMQIQGREVVMEDQDQVLLRIGAGENWHETVRYCVEKGWGGIENLSLIPGTAGAAPIQNIGAYGVELEEVFVNLEAIELASADKRVFTKEECGFGYRDSIFKDEQKGKFAITYITLRLLKQPRLNISYGAVKSELERRRIGNPTIKDVSDVVIDIRNSKLPDPAELGNAGSFFKNPVISTDAYKALQKTHAHIPGYPIDNEKVKVPAGWLIEQAGWKGKVTGNTGTYKQQALVIVNHGGASGKEILALAERIQASVASEFGIELVPEVNIIN